MVGGGGCSWSVVSEFEERGGGEKREEREEAGGTQNTADCDKNHGKSHFWPPQEN
jgi:hypothetical protein